jgi:deoxyribodipyrimidine photo-lyase
MKPLFLPPAPSRRAALDQLQAFLPRAGMPSLSRRDGEGTALPDASGLSPWLRFRLVTEAEVLAALREACGSEISGNAAKAFQRAVLRRAYLKGSFEMRPGLWLAYQQGLRGALNRVATEAGVRNLWQTACEGQTGLADFDDSAQTLARQGHLSQSARVAFVRRWVGDLRLPWELGADFFLRHLLDGDVAITLLSWRDAMGKTGAAPDIPLPGPCPQGGAWDRAAPTALLLHEDDLNPDFLLDGGLKPDQTAFLMAPEGRSPLRVAPAVERFIRGAVADCATRHASALGAIHGPVRGDGAVDALVSWARGTRAVQIVTPFAPVGPVADILEALDARLQAENIRLIRAMRDYDARLWPLATGDFARFLRARPALD